MKIISYKFDDVVSPGWHFEKAEFGAFNLLVGQSASGKTRLLNTIFNLGAFAVREKDIRPGHWEVIFEQEGKTYSWSLKVTKVSPEERKILEETIKVKDGEREISIVERTREKFLFNGIDAPKLSLSQSSIYLLKEEESINPIYKGFASILRRRFYAQEMDEMNKSVFITQEVLHDMEKNKSDLQFISVQPLSIRLYFLEKYYPEKFNRIRDYYKSIFPFIIDAQIKAPKELSDKLPIPGEVPYFMIKEKHVDKLIALPELSSGMQKVLLVLTDIETLPSGSIYMIDEYENSLGTNAIDFFPTYLDEIDEEHQFFVTSHHPYLINNVNPKDWYILHRKGSHVNIHYGAKNIERYGKSKQQAFIQLINDSFYKEGIE